MKTRILFEVATLAFWTVASFGLSWAALNGETFTTTLFVMTLVTFTCGLITLTFVVVLKTRENRAIPFEVWMQDQGKYSDEI